MFADQGLNRWIVFTTIWSSRIKTGTRHPLPLVGAVAFFGAAFIIAAAWHSQDLRRLRILCR